MIGLVQSFWAHARNDWYEFAGQGSHSLVPLRRSMGLWELSVTYMYYDIYLARLYR